MNQNASVQFVMRFVKERHQYLINSLDALVKIIVSEDLDGKKKHAQVAFQKARDLQSAISQQDRPNWLPTLMTNLNAFVEGQWTQHHLIQYLFSNLEIVKSHVWSFEAPPEVSFDFDSIYEHYKSESRLPELFDEIIRILEEIKDSGEIDSLTMISALGKVIANLKAGKSGSYLSLNAAWRLLISFLNNYMWAELSKLPVLGTAMEALKETIIQANEEMAQVHTKIKQEMESTVGTEVKALENKAAFKFIGYDKSGGTITEGIGKIGSA